MENEIKVGEWVKLDNGNIGQVIAVEKGSIMLDIVQNRWVGMCCIKKHSKNIIDLIEVNDYVNGYIVVKINEPSLANDYKRIIYCNKCEGLYQGIFINDEIKSIVTKEQFKSIEYTIHEREEKENEG